jgi:hypothetical protein
MLIRHDSPAPVFNLTVAGEPEFFANGVLVHNCDQMRYAVRYCDKHFPGPALAAGAGFYATPRPRPPGTDRLTGTAAHIWR